MRSRHVLDPLRRGDVPQRLRLYARRGWLRAASLRHRGDAVPGLLSIIVPVYNVEQYLDECLQALRAQDYPNVEIVVVDDGTPDRSVSIARRHRLRDPRIRIVHRPNGGLSAARNTGVSAARGEFLAFADSDDIVPAGGYAAAVTSLQESGSDFAVLPYQRLRRGVVKNAPSWIRDAHAGPRIGISVDDFPDIMVNAIMCSKVFRRDFWRSADLSFVEGIIYEDQQVSAAAFTRASKFDVLTTPVYIWRSRDDRTSISQAKREVDNLRAQFAAANESVGVLRENGSPTVVRERLVQLLSNDLPQFTSLVVGCSDEFWQLLRDELPILESQLDPAVYQSRIPAQQKVLNHLIVSGNRDGAVAFIERGGLGARSVRLGQEDAGHVMYLPLWRDPAAAVPDDCFVLAEGQTRPRTSVRSVEVTRPGTFGVYAFAVMQNVDLASGGQQVRAVARCPGYDEVELPVKPEFDPALDEFLKVSGSGHCDYRNGALRLVIDTTQLGVGTWTVRLDLTVGRLARSVVLGRAWPVGTGTLVQATSAGDGRCATVEVPHGGWLHLRVFDDGLVVEDLALRDRVLTLAGRGAAPDSLEVVGSDAVPVRASIRAGDDGWTATAELPARADDRPVTWRFTARRGHVALPVRYGPGGDEGDLDGAPLRWRPKVSAQGVLTVRTWSRGVVVTGAHVGDDGVALEVRTCGIDLGDHDAVFRNPRGPVTGLLRVTGRDTAQVVLPFRMPRWGRDDQVIEPGSYVLHLVHRTTGARLPARAGTTLLRSVPIDVLTPDVRVQLHLRPSDPRQPVVVIGAPLRPEERGLRNQLALQERANAGKADEPSVFFRTLYGEVTTDNALAVHHELLRRGTDLRLYWSVADRSVPVPEGGIPVLEQSEEWHERLGAARYVMVNVHQPMWYQKPEGQVMVQTFHGYPYKGMGISWWDRSQLASSRVSAFLDRAAAWDYLVSPARYATPLLLREFFRPDAAQQVRVLEAGYPRNDVLVRGDDETRRRVREVLGIGPDQRAVLYAPTFRDYLSSDGMTAASTDFFDAQAAARALGDRYVVLVRGHAFHARANEAEMVGAGIRDVTYYPDINDLCLASDAAILDYSSLRFDYALTRKPMVFLVPDEQAYHQLRPALMDYPPTAPGPRVATTGEAVRLLADLEGLRRSYADRVERFIAEYAEQEDGHSAERVVDAVFGADGGRGGAGEHDDS
jgi:CDP-glycerol glycerophosphotransferase